jgi:hypothetical protein
MKSADCSDNDLVYFGCSACLFFQLEVLSELEESVEPNWVPLNKPPVDEEEPAFPHPD